MSIERRFDRLEAIRWQCGPVIEQWHTEDDVTYENWQGERLTRAEMEARPCDVRRVYIGISAQAMREAETP